MDLGKMNKSSLKLYFLCIYVLFGIICIGQNEIVSKIKSQDEIIQEYLINGAWKYTYLSKEWDEWINLGLQKDSTIAYLWQQKALPFLETKKISASYSVL